MKNLNRVKTVITVTIFHQVNQQSGYSSSGNSLSFEHTKTPSGYDQYIITNDNYLDQNNDPDCVYLDVFDEEKQWTIRGSVHLY